MRRERTIGGARETAERHVVWGIAGLLGMLMVTTSIGWTAGDAPPPNPPRPPAPPPPNTTPGRSYAFIGVSMAAMPPQLAERYQLPEGKQTGVLVNQTIPNSPAQKAGLKTGDVIHSVDGQGVEDPADLLEAIAYQPIGAEVTLEISRPGAGYKGSTRQQVRMTVAERTDGTNVEEALDRLRNPPQRRGGRTEAVGADPLAIGGLSLGPASEDGSVPGLRVFTVVPNSEAAMAGFFQGDLLRKINGRDVNNRSEILEVLNQADPKQPVVVEFERDGKNRTIRWALTLPLPPSLATPKPTPMPANPPPAIP